MYTNTYTTTSRHRRCSWNTLCFESKCRTHTDTEKERHRHTQRHAANSDSPLIFRNLCRNIKYSSTLLRETGTCRISEDHFGLQSMLCRCRASTWASPRFKMKCNKFEVFSLAWNRCSIEWYCYESVWDKLNQSLFSCCTRAQSAWISWCTRAQSAISWQLRECKSAQSTVKVIRLAV